MGEIKASYDTNRQVLGKIFPIDTPFNVIIDSSEVCNFKCNYCFRADSDKTNWGYAGKPQLMDWDVFTAIVDQIKEFPQEVKQISLSNHGEPLANRRIPDMVRYIRSQGITSRTSIHTNASLLDTEFVDDLADCNLSRIVISLQGVTEQKYKEVCGFNIDYQKFYNNLKRLYEKKKETQIFVKVANVALEPGEEDIFYQMYQPIADRAFVETIVPIWEGVNVKGAATDAQNKYGVKFEKQKCCPLIFHTIVVSPSGDIYPCTQLLYPESIGNVLETTLTDCWNSQRRKQLLIDQVALNNPSVCDECGILQNSIYAEADMIDPYREEIYERLINI